MAISLFTALSLAVIYRVTINLPDLPYSSDLRRPGSPEHFEINTKVVDAIDGLLTPIPGDFRASVLNYRYHQVIGTLATIDIYADRDSSDVKRAFLEAIDDGQIGDLAVASDGFEFHVIKGSGGSCNPEQFACLDGTCIDAKLRCDGIADCDDKSDEIADFAMCKRSLPVISLSKKSVDIPLGGAIQLSAVIHRVPVGHQVIWSRNDEIIGQGGIKTISNPRVHVYRSADEYFLRIDNAHSKDSGNYSVQVEGYALKATVPVKVHHEDKLKSETAGCPPGERACKSGHCFPTYYFCDRHVHCPDGDDETNCTVITCRSSEFKCEAENSCISHVSVCDGVRDCRDGSDEKSCNVPKPTSKPSRMTSRPTVNCPDGSTPEFSLHGSTYCWSNSVCPKGSACLQSQCCKTAMSENLRLCPDWKWECGTGDQCLSMEKRCDGVADCRDRSDEMHCGNEKRSVLHVCADDEFHCDSGECIPKEQECNRHYDCSDGTDESKCEYFLAAARYHSQQNGERHESQQSHHEPQHEKPREEHHEHHRQQQHHPDQQQQQHDAHNEQQHHEQQPEEHLEEIECSDQEFRCPYLKETVCFHYDKLCDGVDDCGDGSDEQKCESGSVEDNTQCHQGEYQCANGQCIEESLKCNRKYDCEDGTDETECEYFKLAMNRHQNGESERARAEAELKHREEEERRREQLEREREQEELRREHDERRLEEQERQREAEERQRIEEERRRLDQAAKDNVIQIPGDHEVQFKEEYDDDGELCLEHEFMCHNGECIDRRRVCDSRHDCIDGSDEFDCPEDRRHPQHQESGHHQPTPAPAAPTHQEHHRQHQHQDISPQQDIQITIYPDQISVREGRDANFECRARTADNNHYPSVRWTRVGGPLPKSAHEGGGRLVLNPVSLADSGTYVCVASHNGRTAEAHATLHVQSYGPQELQGFGNVVGGSTGGSCMADEKSCANSECVKSDYVCDGEPDCRDRSDEQNCPSMRTCEPNEFKCHNNRCVQKMWLCDGDDDCGDNSDELNCGEKTAGELCKPTEFKCRSGEQCVPASFQCDGTNDCSDASDEFGCRQPEVVQPPETNKTVPVGSNFQLSCRAVAVPEAYINWRLNWGPVCEPPRCLQQSEGGVGTLTVNNAQPMDEGAYSCEAINVRGRVLATPDCIVRIVNIPAPTVAPPPPQPQVHCDPRGSASYYPDSRGQCPCKPLVTGPQCNQCAPGAYQLSEKAPQGCLKCFCFGITNQCQSSRWYRTKEKLMFAGDAEGVTLSDLDERNIRQNERFEFNLPGMLTHTGNQYEPLYWRLPQRFLGNKVTAYGGKMSFEVQYSGQGGLSQEPVVVLKGNRIVLVHRPRDQDRLFTPDRPVRIDIETYATNYQHQDGRQATREDLMMVLADLDSFMIRAKHVDNQYSSSLGDVSWEIAVDRDTQGELALEVEHCSCPPGYMGLSCEDCAPGYERSGHGPYLGTCVPARPRGPTCSAGAISPQSYGGQCQCKLHTTGPLCDQCKPNSFHLAPTNTHGCIPCFCSGVTKDCQSSSLRRDQVLIDYGRGDQDHLQLKSKDHRNPVSPRSQANIGYGAINFDRFDETPGTTLYWSLPAKFLGNKVTSYGGYLKYTFRYSGDGRLTTDPDVILRGNDIMLQYTHRQPFQPDRENTVEIKIVEDSFHRPNDGAATREHMIMTLADLDEILIKATYLDDCSQSSLVSVSLDYATPQGPGLTAYEVEQCRCPPGYQGTSCEDCSPGYSRSGGGLYLGLCERCECHGHATECDKEYGFCVSCQHNTEGEHCDRCKPGFVGDARRGTPHDCQPAATRPPCQCNNHSPRGCDSFGRCLFCEHNTEGVHCEQCKKGFYGVATRGTPYDCTPCPCPSASECFLDPQGQVHCRNCPAGYTGRLCNECGPGYTRSTDPGRRECKPIGHVKENEVVFVPSPEVHLRVEIVEPKHLRIVKGQRAKWICQIVGQRPPDVTLVWSKVGSPSLPRGAQVNDGRLILDSVELGDSGQYRCTGTTPKHIATDDATLAVSEGGQPPQLYIDPPHLKVPERSSAKFVCHVMDVNKCEVTWHKEYVGGPLPHGVYPQGDVLQIPAVLPEHEGHYICSVVNEHGMGRSNPAKLEVIRPVEPPRVDPFEQTVNEGDNARFRCWVPNNPSAVLTWTAQGGRPLPHGAEQNQGYLNFPRATHEHVGSYVCTATDPTNANPPLDSVPATLNVRKPEGPIIDPPEQEVAENEPATFRCHVPGNPYAQLRFTKQGGALSYGAQEHQGTLSIPRAQMGDAGSYICTADDPAGGPPRDSQPAILRVTPPAHGPVIDPPEQEVAENEPARFRCYVPGNPHARLRFSKQGGALPHGAHDQQGHLTIPRAQLADAGNYICTAEDPRGGSPRDSSPAILRVTPPAHGPIIDPPEQEVAENEPARFRCHVPGNPHARLRFSKQGGALPHGAQEQQGHLSIPRAQLGDAGSYICTAEDPRGGAPRDSSPAVLRVRPGAQKPQVDPPTQSVNEGEPAQYRCWVPGNPNAQLRWSKEGRQPLPQGAYERDGVLHIPRARTSDGGNYVCTAFDPVTRIPIDSDPVSLNVNLRPIAQGMIRPLIDPPEQTVDENDDAVIRCWVEDQPGIHLRWRKENGQPLPYGSLDRDGILTIRRTQHADAGLYICSAVDPVTHSPIDSEPARVNVRSPAPKPLVTPPHQEVDEDHPATFKCYIPGVAHGDHEFRWGFRTPDGSLPEGVTDDDGELTVHRAKPHHSGEFYCTYDGPDGPKTSDPARLQVNKPGQPPRPVATPPEQIVKTGTPARFHCDAHSQTPAQIHWGFKVANGGLPDDVYQEGDDVVIDHSDESNIGIYVCTATNEFGTGEADPVRLDVSDDEIPPTARVEPRVWNGQPGQTHVFTCHVTGVPPPQVSWTGPNGVELPENVRDIGNNQLEFVDAKTDMNGEYTCHAVNIIGEASDTGTVNVGPSLTVKTDPAGPRIVLTVGEPLEVKCEAFGEPEPEVEWLHDPGPIRGDLPDDFKPVVISEQFIRHPAVGLGNSGVYTCRGYNSHASATKDIHIEVVQASRIATVSILGGAVQYFSEGEPAELVCTSTGPSLVERLEWARVDNRLPSEVEDHNEPGFLHFGNFKREHAGEYECRGYRNNEIIATSSVKIYPDGHADPDVPRVEITSPRVKVVNEGESIILDCIVEDRQIPYTIEWMHSNDAVRSHQVGKGKYLHLRHIPLYRSGLYWIRVTYSTGHVFDSPASWLVVRQRSIYGDLHSGVNYDWALLRSGSLIRRLGSESQLVVKKADPTNDFGVYRCEVEDDNGQHIGNAYAAVTVGHSSPESPQTVRFDDKSDASFVCPVFSVPGAVVTWEKENDQLPPNAEPHGSRLHIKDFDATAAGMYVCRVKVDHNTAEGYVDAQIYVPDSIIQVRTAASTESFVLGERAWVDCVVTGDPKAEVRWSKEGADQLPSNTQVTGIRLQFTQVTEDDDGVYVCHASTSAGNLVTRTVIKVAPSKRKRKHTHHSHKRNHQNRGHLRAHRNTIRKHRQNNPVFGLQYPQGQAMHALPIIRAVGEEVNLACPSSMAKGLPGKVTWEKVDGDMPFTYRVNQGVLAISDLKKKDAGMYKCTTETNGLASVTHVTLEVTDFVPQFNGIGHLEIEPLEEPTWKNLDVILSVKPNVRDGLIFYTEKAHPQAPKPENYHSAGLKHGKVFYKYNVGDGDVTIQSNHPVRVGEWQTIQITNTPEKGTLVVNAYDLNEHQNKGTPVSTVESGNVNLGGLAGVDIRKSHVGVHKPFIGSISQLVINGESVDLGQSSFRDSDVRQTQVCTDGPCQNGAVCTVANVPKGFVCTCAHGYSGDVCQFKDGNCTSTKVCKFGACVDGECLCPYNRRGDQCEQTEDEPLESAQFDGLSSYVALDTPESLRNFSVMMKLQVKDTTKDQLIAYVGSDYNPKVSHVLGLAIINGKFTHIYNNGDGHMVLESDQSINPGEVYTVEIKRRGQKSDLKVNGRKVAIGNKVRLEPFVGGTELFIGGLAPGVPANRHLASLTPLDGCVFKIAINKQYVNLRKVAEQSSANVRSCGDLYTTTPVPIVKDTTTESPATSTHAPATEAPATEPALPTRRPSPSPSCTGRGCGLIQAKCEPETCGSHGDCEVVNGTHVACICRDYYDGPSCDQFKPIEYAARFDGKAYIEFTADDFPHLTSEKEEVIEVRFKTRANNGIIFWQGQHPDTTITGEDYISIGLNDGYLVYAYELGGGAAHITSNRRVNDNKEYRLKAIRKGRNGTLIINNGEPVKGSSSGILEMLNVEGNIFMGGLPSLDVMTGGLHSENFVGCLADLRLNGQKMDLMAHPIDGKGVKPCDSWQISKKRWIKSKSKRFRNRSPNLYS